VVGLVVLVLAGAPGVATAATGVAFVQGTTFGTGTTVTSTQARLTGAVAAGDLLVGWFSQYNASGTVQVADNVNGAWTRAPASIPWGSAGDNALYYVQNTAGSSAGLTVTVSAATATYLQGTFAEYSGVATSGGLDQSATGKGTGTAVTTGATAPVSAGDLVFSALVTGGNPSSASPGGSQGVNYTARAKSATGSLFSEDITASAAGTQVGTATLGASTNWIVVVAAFHPAVSSQPQPPAAPTGLTATSTTASQVALSWTAPTADPAVTGYTVFRNGAQVGTATTTGFTDATVAPSTTYSYTVTASNSAGTSPPSSPLSVTTPTAPPCSAAGLSSAISAANATSGGGTVTLTAGCTYTLTSAGPAPDGATGLPAITGTVTVEGNGATITRSTAPGTTHFRLFDVAQGGSLTLRNLTLANGLADDGVNGGGAVYNHGALTVTGGTFSSNSSPASTGTSGGAIENSGTLQVGTSLFTGGVAQEGGGVFNQSTATITQSTFTDNTATIFGGGALLNAFGTMTVTTSTFVGNSGPGGGVLDNDTTATISDSTMYGNTGGSHGGGAVQNFGTLTLTTSTLSGNSSPFGANIYNYGSSQITVSSTIVADGQSGSNCGGSAVVDGGYNLDTASSCGFTSAQGSRGNAAPQLQPLAANGGPTRTMALTPGSPAVDVIPSATQGCSGTGDQRGVSRPQGAACDIGAYELLSTGSDTQAPTVPTGLTADSTTAGALSLSWTPSTDDVGVAGYTVYRNGTAIGTSGGSTPSYTDSTAAPSTTYQYAVDAVDAAGNRSAPSAPLSVTSGPAPPAAPHRVQGAAAGTGSKVMSLTLQLGSAVAAGDLLVGWFGQYDSTGAVQVSDNVNGAWTRAASTTTFGSGHGDIALYYVQNAAAAPSGLTLTVSAAAGTYLQATAAEYTGVARTGALDTAAIGKGTSTTADTAATTAVNAGELVFSGLMTGGNPGSATPNGGLSIHDHTASFSVDDADAVAASGVQHAAWTLQTATDWYDLTAVFHTAAGP
jgi:chitodextrinase